MITFNGIGIKDIAPVDIADIVVSTVRRSVVSRDRPILPGAEFVRVTDSTRQVTITLADRTSDMESRISEIEAINAWAATTEPGKLVLPYQGGKYLNALCTSYVEPSYRQWWENKLKLVFTAYDPYFNAPAENHVSIGQGTTVTFTGSAEPLVRIETTLEEAASSLVWSDGTNTLTLSGTIPVGTVTVDLNRQTVRHNNGTSLSPLITLASRFPAITRKMTITGPGTIYWRERYV